jgi:hypothetical protein
VQHNSELFVKRREREREKKIAFLVLQLDVGLGGGWELFCSKRVARVGSRRWL